MADFLYSIDRALFYFINHTLQNPLFDLVMPVLTDLNKQPVAIVIFALLWLLLLAKGGRAGRIAALLLIPTIYFSDQLNSTFLKHIFDRLRPCHALEDVHILVPCGSGFSFPSSHAVNNFAAAIVLAFYIPKGKWWFYSFAAAMAFSRPYVGAHYPSDILVGSVVGVGCGALIIFLYSQIEAWWKHRNAPIEEASKDEAET
ncbi:MAG: phosphatase PAP2 family protein [Ignavibacteriae bacterium]|nr:phosphatase PAP2 family protein [Ignavibacteriota bacterium]